MYQPLEHTVGETWPTKARRAAKRIAYITSIHLIIGIGARNVEAVPISIGIEAIVYYLEDQFNLLDNRIQVGDYITGYYIYDSDTPDTHTSPEVGAYWHYSSDYGLSINAGGLKFKTDPNNTSFLISILNNAGLSQQDGYLIRSYNNLLLSQDVYMSLIDWQLEDYSGKALDSDELPLAAPVLEDWQDTAFHLRMGGAKSRSETFDIGAEVTSASVIPEPATIAIFGLGCLLLCLNPKYEYLKIAFSM